MDTQKQAEQFLNRMNQLAEQGKPLAIAMKAAIMKKATS